MPRTLLRPAVAAGVLCACFRGLALVVPTSSPAEGGGEVSSDADDTVTIISWRLERVRMLAKKRDVESCLALVEQEYTAALGRVISARSAPVGHPTNRVKVKGWVRADARMVRV